MAGQLRRSSTSFQEPGTRLSQTALVLRVLLAPAYLPRSIPRLVRRAICPMDFSSVSGKSNLACALSSRQEVYSFSIHQGASSKGAPFLIRQQVLVAVVSTTLR